MQHIIIIQDTNSEFLTRRQGVGLRSKLVEKYEKMSDDDSLVIDFTNLEIMTPSFADECFGKFAERVGFENFSTKISMRNANETVRALINSILNARLHQN